MPVSGQKQTFALQNVMSALPPKAEVDFKCERRFRKQALSDASQSAADTLPNRSQAVLPPTHIWVRGASMFDRKQTLRRLNPQAERPLLVDASTRPSRRLCRRVASSRWRNGFAIIGHSISIGSWTCPRFAGVLSATCR